MADSKVEYEGETNEKTEVHETIEEFDKNGERIYVKSDAEKALVRKLDFIYVMPFIALLNFLQVITFS